jgi:SPP1 gp7 family putative phage head morphogenesis protein
MKIFGYEVLKSDSVKELNKQIAEYEATSKIRPAAQFWEYRQREGAIIPNYATDLQKKDMQHLAKVCSVYRQVVSSLQWELFRRGAEFEPRFTKKCVNVECEKEFDYDAERCDLCNSLTRKPNYAEIKTVKSFVEKVNENGDTLIDVCRQLEFDLNVLDDAFLGIAKEYYFDEEGNIQGGVITEAFRIDPASIFIIADKTLRMGRNWDGKRMMICPVHRKPLLEKDICPTCGKKTHPAYYKTRTMNGIEELFYMSDEIIHVSKFSPSLTYGYPPFLSLYQKVMIELNMDWYVRSSYEKGRPPNGWLFVKTKNIPSLQKAVDWVIEKTKRNPHFVYPLGIDSQDNKGPFVNFVNLMNSMQEMQATEFRNMIKREIGALFGVMPLFQGDISAGGGLNNEGLQVTVTNRAVEVGQGIYNEKVFPRLLEMFGVKDYKYELQPSEEKDEMAELQRFQLEIQNASMMRQMGFEVELNDEGGFEFSGQAAPMQQGGLPQLPFGAEPTYGEQRFGGEPDSVRRSVEKQVKIPLAPGEKPPQGAKLVVGPRRGRYYIPGEKPTEPRAGDRQQPVSYIPGEPSRREVDRDMRQWENRLSKWHENTPKEEPVFVFGRHMMETNQTKAIREQLRGMGATVVEIPLEFHRLQGTNEKDRAKYDDYLSSFFEGRKTVDLHSSEGWPAGEFHREQRRDNLLALEVPQVVGANSREQLSFLLRELRTKPLKKARPPAQSKVIQVQAERTKKTLEDELKELMDIDLKRKPSKAEMRKLIDKLTDKFGSRLKRMTKNQLEKAYKKAMESVEKELELNVIFGESDKNALEVLANSEPLTRAYTGMTHELSQKLNDVIETAYEEPELFTMDKIITAMKKASDEEEYRLARIARTETTKVSNLARANSYLKAGQEDALFKWVGPDDSRTTDICKEIKEKTKNGVKLAKLAELTNNFLPHFQCRHTFVKVV